MSSNFSQEMDKAMAETFGEVCFLDCIPSSQNLQEGVGQVLFIRVFEPFSGFIDMYLPLEIKKLIIENIHQETWTDILPRKIDDTLLEIMNILAGKFLANLTENSSNYRIGLPQILFEQQAPGVDAKVHLFHYDIEDHLAGVRLVIQGDRHARTGG